MRTKKISIKKVQIAFANAIKRRDGGCLIRDCEPCYGQLECSHYHTQGSTPSLMFYPPNAYTQCSKHHWNHHNRREAFFVNVYYHWIMGHHYSDVQKMEILKNRYIKYTDELKTEIIRLCNEDKLDELTELIEKELGYGKTESNNED